MNPHPLDLKPEEIALVKTILKTHVPEYPVWVFGSRIKGKGTAKPYSDLDLAIITDHPLTLTTQANLAEAFSESNLPFRADVLDWASLSNAFQQKIQSQYLVLYP